MLLHFLKQLFRRPRAQGQAVDALLTAAHDALNADDIPAAEQAINAAFAAEPGHEKALFYGGIIAYRRGDLVRALAAFQGVAERVPTNPDYQYRMAVCHHMLGDISLARRCCEAALAAQPDHLGSHNLMARLTLPGAYYTDVLAAFHRHLLPRTYLEIGVASGKSIVLAGENTVAIGIDPAPEIERLLGAHVKLFKLTSDEFFRRHDVVTEFGGRPVDLAFIDGMHRFEFALRDFAAIERHCTPRSIVLIHDCYPLDRRTAEREPITTFWSGDIWRLVLALKKYRPDLEIRTIATPPTGLTLIRRLNPSSRILAEQMDRIVAELLAVDYSVLDADKPGMLNLFPNEWAKIAALLDQAES